MTAFGKNQGNGNIARITNMPSITAHTKSLFSQQTNAKQTKHEVTDLDEFHANSPWANILGSNPFSGLDI